VSFKKEIHKTAMCHSKKKYIKKSLDYPKCEKLCNIYQQCDTIILLIQIKIPQKKKRQFSAIQQFRRRYSLHMKNPSGFLQLDRNVRKLAEIC